MKLTELQEYDIIWEGEDVMLVSEPIKEGRRVGFRSLASKAVAGITKNPFVSLAAATLAVDVFQKYKKNKRLTTQFFAKGMQEKKLYQGIVNDLMKTGHYKKVRERSVAGGYMWELKRT